eukprot:TRINITY_DN11962_c0_g1_i1.p1 TRINITY_DN11962_c0_g1~~TRINITY_DN11962_c0_g1_i1.p1  ORF type:complete len:338 (+),score=115.70 TRINITY_DN11962_c0_g1_i1:108-1121(+)
MAMHVNGTGTLDALFEPAAPDTPRCTILESAVDYIIQAVLGVIAFSTLIAKWRMEAKGGGARRPVRVFLLDTTKQCAGFFVAHIGNMIVAELLAAEGVSPCVWYFVNIVFDTTVRVLFAYLLLRGLEFLIRKYRLDPKGMMDFGDYGDLYVLTCSSMKRWFFQLAVWVGIVVVTCVMKGLLIWVLEEPLAAWGTWTMGPLERYTAEHGHTLELIVVMMILPFLLCTVQLWVQDSFLQSKKRGQGLHRFDPAQIEIEGDAQQRTTALEAFQPTPEPIFLFNDALWGPDSYSRGILTSHGPPPAIELTPKTDNRAGTTARGDSEDTMSAPAVPDEVLHS